jgi:hypothetical protein
MLTETSYLLYQIEPNKFLDCAAKLGPSFVPRTQKNFILEGEARFDYAICVARGVEMIERHSAPDAVEHAAVRSGKIMSVPHLALVLTYTCEYIMTSFDKKAGLNSVAAAKGLSLVDSASPLAEPRQLWLGHLTQYGDAEALLMPDVKKMLIAQQFHLRPYFQHREA